MPVLFFIISLLYATVGFGGGSSYIALLVLFDTPYELLPSIALVCNLIVVSGGTWLFVRRGHFEWARFWPLALSSVPMAYLGGRIPLSAERFLIILGVVLLISGLRLLWQKAAQEDGEARPLPRGWALLAGAGLGLLAGLVGIGGGIFLAPLMLNLRWGKTKQVAAVCSAFILVNSVAGLCGQLMKQSVHIQLLDYLPLFLAVLVGGQIGSRMGSGNIPALWMRRLTAVLVIYVGARVLWRWWAV